MYRRSSPRVKCRRRRRIPPANWIIIRPTPRPGAIWRGKPRPRTSRSSHAGRTQAFAFKEDGPMTTKEKDRIFDSLGLQASLAGASSGGKWFAGSGDAIEVRSPATGELLAKIE